MVHVDATWRIRLNCSRAAAMRPFVKNTWTNCLQLPLPREALTITSLLRTCSRLRHRLSIIFTAVYNLLAVNHSDLLAASSLPVCLSLSIQLPFIDAVRSIVAAIICSEFYKNPLLSRLHFSRYASLAAPGRGATSVNESGHAPS